ncbi:ABC transporter permease [Marinifilum fragile]|uniref:ABC transporter permease n=1 Tax=Marinifilum fragile TaxID=570161 RepID=UPI0006D26FB6|nr:ABC transporter permease [Marinifilum fragile]
MNFYNIKISFKNLLKNKLVSSINISGLVIGITISLLVFAYVNKEKNMDQEIADIEYTYTLLNQKDPDISSAMVRHVRSEVPEIEAITFARYTWSPQDFLKKENTDYKLQNLLIADSCFFKVFQFKAVYGNPKKALNTADKIVLTQSVAKKIFGDENPIGKELLYNATNLQNVIVEVGAVIQDLSHHCSWEFDAVLSLDTNYKIHWFKSSEEYWGTQNYSAFAKIPSNIDAGVINRKLANISTDNIPEGYKEDTKFEIKPFTEAYNDLPEIEILKHGNQLTLNIIQIIGFLILLLACINYINLVTAQKIKRLKNIGILKVMGSKKAKVVELIAAESALVLCITCILVIVLSNFLLIGLNQITNSEFTLAEIFSGSNLIIFIALLAFTFVLTGIIPGIRFSRTQTTALLKNTVNSRSQNHLRNALLIFQFSITIILLCGILLINKQNNYMSELDPGFDKEQILYAATNPQIEKSSNAFNSEIKRIPEISDYTYTSGPLGYNQSNWGLSMINKGEKQEIGFANLFVSPNFFDFFGIKLIQGKQFNRYSEENADWIFNATAFKQFNIEKPEDATIRYNGKVGKVIAEVEDFNHESMHSAIRPIAFRSCGETDEYIYFKINTSSVASTNRCIRSINKVWENISPNFPLEIKYLDASWEALYKKEKQFQRILNYATIISILLSCLGLISLTYFIVETHTKEIGIRKTNGAKTFEIVKMLNTDLVKWVFIACIIACPIAWYALHTWLSGFAYKTELSWWVFALAGIIALGIALLTVSWQSWRAAKRNPVESLRYE